MSSLLKPLIPHLNEPETVTLISRPSLQAKQKEYTSVANNIRNRRNEFLTRKQNGNAGNTVFNFHTDMPNNGLLDASSNSDVTIISQEGKRFPCLKFCCCLRSHYLYTLFSQGVTEVVVPHSDVITELIINYLHYATITITKENVYDLLMGASYFGLAHLVKECFDYYIGERDENNQFYRAQGAISQQNLNSDRRCIDKMSDLWNLIQAPVYSEYAQLVKQWIFGHWCDETRTVPNERKVKVGSAFLKCEAPLLSYSFIKDCVLNTNYVEKLEVEEAIRSEISNYAYFIPNEDVFAYLISDWFKFNLSIATSAEAKTTLNAQVKDLIHRVNWASVSEKATKYACTSVPELAADINSFGKASSDKYEIAPRQYDQVYSCPELPYYDHAMAIWQYSSKKEQFCGYKTLSEIQKVQIFFPCRERDFTKMINTFYLLPNLKEIVLCGEMSDHECNDLVDVLKADDLPNLTTINLKDEKTLSASSIATLNGVKGSAHCPKLNTIVPRS